VVGLDARGAEPGMTRPSPVGINRSDGPRALFLLPLILGYTAWSYWVSRGKVRGGSGYH